MSTEDRIFYLEEERKKIWERLTALDQQILIKASDNELVAKEAAENAAKHEKLSQEASVSITEIGKDAEAKIQDISNYHTELTELKNVLDPVATEVKLNHQNIVNYSNESHKLFSQITDHASLLETHFKSIPQAEEQLKKIAEIYVKSDDYDSKLTNLFKVINDRKKEIDTLYYEIIGSVSIDENGKEIVIDGLKAKLENSYVKLEQQVPEIQTQITSLDESTKLRYDTFVNESAEVLNDKIANWEAAHNNIIKRISDLLPNAMTAGLSFAYSQKKNEEELERRKNISTFKWAIFGLVLVSLIPIGVSINSLSRDSMEVVISRLPRLAFAILPLYFPILWVAYSTNRKLNLSKRLIEEYSHKEVLSKTFEGLSREIKNIDDENVSGDLRNRLLYNILEVNSENPGKLISDYNKSDHPLIDTLDKSVKLTNSMTKLANIPGFRKLAESMAEKSKRILEEGSRKAEIGIEVVEESRETS